MSEIEETLGCMEGLAQLKQTLAELPEQQSYIHKVGRPRQLNEEIYDPQFVAIGPYHHGKDKLVLMEQQKFFLMRRILLQKPDVQIGAYWTAIEEMETRARHCYSEPIHMNSKEFIQMLMVDSLFLLELVSHSMLLNMNLLSDLMLVENQIPFFVLNKVAEIHHGSAAYSSVLVSNILNFCSCTFPGKVCHQSVEMRDPQEILHILDLVHTNWYPKSVASGSNRLRVDSALWIPTVSQLQLSNIKFCRKDYARVAGCETTLFDVNFVASECWFPAAKMLMPTLTIIDGTEIILKNLIAYEHSLPIVVRAPVTDYARLLGNLIGTEEDVKILCKRGIIKSHLGSLEAVAKVAKSLCDGVSYSEVNYTYEDLFVNIRAHYLKARVIVSWCSHLDDFRRTYARFPWGVLTAGLILLLTILQTIFTGIQTFQKHRG